MNFMLIGERICLGAAWVDLLLPLSLLGLAFERSGDPLWMIISLTFWCILKCIARMPQQPVYGVIIGIIVVSLGVIVHPESVSSPADMILVLVAFAAGLNQTNQHWKVTLFILLAGVFVSIPFLETRDYTYNGNLSIIPFSSLRELLPQTVFRLQKITINRSGYIFGMMSLFGCGLWRFSRRSNVGLLAGIAGAISIILAFATGSRASFGFPFLAVIITEFCWRNKERVRRTAGRLAGFVIVMAFVLNLFMYLPFGSFAKRSLSDSERASVAQCFVRESFKSWPGVAIGDGFDRRSDRCSELTDNVSHAHNAFLQVLGDQGLIAFLLMILALWVILQRLFIALAWDDLGVAWIGLACTLFIMTSGLVESTLIKTSFQQVVTGYVLSMAWMCSSDSPDEKSDCFKS